MGERASETAAVLAIAAYLPEGARRAAADAWYRRVPWRLADRMVWRTEDNCCPMATALRHMGLDVPGWPNNLDVAEALVGLERTSEWEAVSEAARAFIAAWDFDQTVDPDTLAEAFGVASGAEALA